MLLIWNLLYCSILTWKLFKSLCDEFHKKLLLTTKQWNFKEQWSQQEKNISGTSDLQGHMAHLNSIRSDQHFLAPFWSCICTTAFAIKFTSSQKKNYFQKSDHQSDFLKRPLHVESLTKSIQLLSRVILR